jgi:hypothetical protein
VCVYVQDKRFPESKTSTLLSIFKTLLEGDRRRLLIGTGNMKRSYEHLEKLLLEHAVERPPVRYTPLRMAHTQQTSKAYANHAKGKIGLYQ